MLTVPQQGLVPKQVLLWLHDVVVVVVVQSPVERKSGRKDHLIKRINIRYTFSFQLSRNGLERQCTLGGYLCSYIVTET